MSYTEYFCTAKFEVSPSFDVETFLKQVTNRAILEGDQIYIDNGEVNGILDVNLESYICKDGNKVVISTDSDDLNCDSEVFDYLCKCGVKQMTSKFMLVKSITLNSRSGADCGVYLYNMNNDFITLDDLINHYASTKK
jgi:hypothetical protein